MPEPGSPEWQEHLATIVAEEAHQPEALWYLSFAAEEGFRGVVIVRARGMTFALMRAKELGINPGGQVLSFAVPLENEALIPADMYDRLLGREELEARLGPCWGLKM